ncbi:MAG TPA: hypothetical protein VKZ53_04895 [Candidatus Angelobacter sp.]|nr:hypothetical protein [Candidatus Angelobacter sp.]
MIALSASGFAQNHRLPKTNSFIPSPLNDREALPLLENAGPSFHRINLSMHLGEKFEKDPARAKGKVPLPHRLKLSDKQSFHFINLHVSKRPKNQSKMTDSGRA